MVVLGLPAVDGYDVMTWRAARFGFIWVARATSRPREGALWAAMVQKVLSRARVGVLVACGCAGAVTTAPRARCEHCRPSRQLFRRRARARAAANARFRLLDAAGALCSGTGVRETRLRCFGAAQCQVRRLCFYTSTEQPEGMTPRSYLHSTWRYGRGGLLRGSQGCRAAPGTSERGSRCAFVVGCRKRLPRLGWLDARLVSEAARLPRDTCGASDPRAVDHRLGSVG